ncbi:MAG: sensor domain-containing protein [Steroidobacteraceae bacterium]
MNVSGAKATLASPLERVCALIGLSAVAVGLMDLSAWVFDMQSLPGQLPGWFTMKASAAGAFMLCGASLWWSVRHGGRSESRLAARVMRLPALLAGGIGVLSLAEHAFGWGAEINQLMSHLPAVAQNRADAGGMAPLTAVNFILTAAALLLLDFETPRGLRPSNWLALVITFTVALPLLGYLYGIDVPHRSALIVKSMALGNAILFVALSVGIVCARPEARFIRRLVTDTAGGMLARRLLPAAIAIPPMIGWLRWQGEEAGYYSSEFGLAIFIIGNLTAFGFLAWWSMRDLSAIHRAEQVLQQALVRSDAMLRRAQDIAQLAHVITAPDGSFESWSDTFPGLLGVDREHLPRSARRWLRLIHPDDRALFRQQTITAARKGERTEFEYRVRRRDSWVNLRHVSELLSAPAGDNGSGRRWFNTLQDVTAQKSAEVRVRNLNRMYAMLSGINSVIIRVQTREALFREACRLAVDVGKFTFAWIGLIDADQAAIRLVAWSGTTEKLVAELRDRLQADGAFRDSLLQDCAGMQPVVLNDIGHDVDMPGMGFYGADGARARAVMPLTVGGEPIGVLVLHTDVPLFFDADEVALLRELSGDISFAVDVLMKTERLAYFSTHDPVTGLPNRRQFIERLAQQVERGNDGSRLLAVVLIDLQRFRLVNETWGRTGGDELLKMAAKRLQQVNSSAACIGVGQFAFYVKGKTSVSEVALALDDLSRRLCGEPFILEGKELRIGCRGGVAVFPNDASDAEALIRNAEAALRRAKGGAEKYVYYSPEMNARATEVLTLESQLRRAADQSEFVLYYQPKVNLSDGRISGVEALIRWQNPEQGLVPPARFIRALEETGLVGTVGQWALERALADQRRWRVAGREPPRVAVNVSPLQLQCKEFAARVGDLIRGYGDAALELEITESMLLEDLEHSVSMVKMFRGHGVNVVIDDFGTGYCSLLYLAKLPVTAIKIDQSFVRGLMEGSEYMAIVSSIISLAHTLKLRVVAEGVETAEQARLLRLFECDEAQGFLYSRPVPAQEIEAMLAVGARCQS